MNDASQLQCLANGTTNGTFGALTQSGTGAIVAASAAGTYTITLDAGLLGDNAAPSKARVLISLLGSAANANVAGLTKTLVGGQLQIAFTTQIAAGAAANEAFDYVIWADPSN
jgi:hypothetical protein